MVFDHETAKEAGRRGGLALLRKYGLVVMRERGRRGGAAVVKERGTAFMRRIASLGGKARAEKYRREREEAGE